MEQNETRAGPRLASLERVRCLECGSSYAKPADGGTVHENPGCPKCGYLGWITTMVPMPGLDDGQPRFDEDQPLRHASR